MNSNTRVRNYRFLESKLRPVYSIERGMTHRYTNLKQNECNILLQYIMLFYRIMASCILGNCRPRLGVKLHLLHSAFYK